MFLFISKMKFLLIYNKIMINIKILLMKLKKQYLLYSYKLLKQILTIFLNLVFY